VLTHTAQRATDLVPAIL